MSKINCRSSCFLFALRSSPLPLPMIERLLVVGSCLSSRATDLCLPGPSTMSQWTMQSVSRMSNVEIIDAMALLSQELQRRVCLGEPRTEMPIPKVDVTRTSKKKVTLCGNPCAYCDGTCVRVMEEEPNHKHCRCRAHRRQ